jgi:hypothetical protein
VAFTSTYHVLLNAYTPFPALPNFWQKNSRSDLWSDPRIYPNQYAVMLPSCCLADVDPNGAYLSLIMKFFL